MPVGQRFMQGIGGRVAVAAVVPTSGAGAGPRCSSRPSFSGGRRRNALLCRGAWHRDVANRARRGEHPSSPVHRSASSIGVRQRCGVAWPRAVVMLLGSRIDCTPTSSGLAQSLLPPRVLRRGTRSMPYSKRWRSLSLHRAGSCTRAGPVYAADLVRSRLGTFQYGFLHLGHTLGNSMVVRLGTHSWPQRSQRHALTWITAILPPDWILVGVIVVVGHRYR